MVYSPATGGRGHGEGASWWLESVLHQLGAGLLVGQAFPATRLCWPQVGSATLLPLFLGHH